MGEPIGSVTRWLEHVRALAHDIGPRGPGTPAEGRALDYCRETLASLGLSPGEDRFLTSGSVFRPHLVAGLGVIVAFLLYRVQPWLGAVLAVAVVVLEVLELTLRPNLLQLVPPRLPSRNVWAMVEPRSGPVQQDLVLMGHVDTQRTPIIFSTPRWFTVYRVFSTVAFVSFALMAAGYVLGATLGWPWVWPASSVGAVLALLVVAMCVEAELSPQTAGANDNATAAAFVLTLGEELGREPLTRTRVWLVCSGSEEALHEGAREFYRRHRSEMVAPRAIVLEMLGVSGPAWLESEEIVLRLRSDAGLQQLAERVARERPDLGAYPTRLTGGVTEMSDALAAGVPAITVIGLTREGKGPYWHLPTDTVDKMDPAVMERNYGFVKALIEAVDER